MNNSAKFQVGLVMAQFVTLALLGFVYFQLGLVQESRLRQVKVDRTSGDDVCVNRIEGRRWCALDFVRVAAFGGAIDGGKLYVLGYMAVDRGVVSLFASEQDYANGEKGRSLELRARREELVDMIKQYGYTYVRVEGTFELDDGARKSGRLGALHPPFRVVPVPKRGRNQSAEDILVHATYSGEPN